MSCALRIKRKTTLNPAILFITVGAWVSQTNACLISQEISLRRLIKEIKNSHQYQLTWLFSGTDSQHDENDAMIVSTGLIGECKDLQGFWIHGECKERSAYWCTSWITRSTTYHLVRQIYCPWDLQLGSFDDRHEKNKNNILYSNKTHTPNVLEAQSCSEVRCNNNGECRRKLSGGRVVCKCSFEWIGEFCQIPQTGIVLGQLR